MDVCGAARDARRRLVPVAVLKQGEFQACQTPAAAERVDTVRLRG